MNSLPIPHPSFPLLYCNHNTNVMSHILLCYADALVDVAVAANQPTLYAAAVAKTTKEENNLIDAANEARTRYEYRIRHTSDTAIRHSLENIGYNTFEIRI
ncbi:hypothetical protein MtrunA17_Chr4g0021251 [Medicago truncatula]|uniref:Uncharacterized protein n=1 Tax=Medicago truncatula TaxID=3880 RepID=A0A072TKM0_MEDTR|nr:hypothetical protein MTR_0001s0500 [Medicago truncatula]RHN60073.1 hypothetical protein MtrunA17_Chr4g0021251 [Medicago truncatula]